MSKFKKCPRCDLNYILQEEQYCKICLEELRGISHLDEDLEEEIEETEEGRLCPRCHINFLKEGEAVCSCCLAEQAADEKGELVAGNNGDEFEPDWGETEPSEDESIGEPTDDVADDELDLSLDELRDGEEEEEEEEEEYAKGKNKKGGDDDEDFDFDGNIDDIADDEDEDDEKDDEDDDL